MELPADRFDDTGAELFRFTKACGLLQAKSPEARASAVEAAFSRVVHTAEWVGRQRFMGPRELRRWERLVAWKAHDASERPAVQGWPAVGGRLPAAVRLGQGQSAGGDAS